MRRVWEDVSVRPVGTAFAIHLDGKPMRLPGGGVPLTLPNATMAEALAGEWARAGGGAKGGEFTMAALPLTQLAATAQERITPDPGPTAAALAAYGETDLLCYRADRPERLVLLQSRSWQPWLDWVRRAHGVRLRVGTGIAHVAQDAEALDALHRAVARLDAWTLAGMGVAVPVLGSLVLGLALQAGELDAAGAHGLAELDAVFQAEQWGADEDATVRAANVAREVAEAATFMRLARGALN